MTLDFLQEERSSRGGKKRKLDRKISFPRKGGRELDRKKKKERKKR